MLLKGKKAIVTGASSGIGKATAQRLGREGASVCVNYFSDKEADAAQAIARDIAGAGDVRAIAVQADVGSEGDVRRMVRETVEAFGGVDLLVNNAGIEKQVPLLETSLEAWESILRTNLTGAFLCIREVGRQMVDGGGVVVNMSSVHEFIPWPEFAIVTPINTFVLDDPEAKHAVEQEIPLGHMGNPEDIAAAVVWAASAEANYVTGTTIVVDGGMSLYPRFV